MRLILTGGFARLLASFGTVIVSFAIVRMQSTELWGEVVSYAILIDFGFAVVNWGATPYLIRQFSLHPKNRSDDWGRATASRTALLAVLLLLIASFSMPWTLKLLLFLWAAARFVYQSFEPLVQYERPFLLSLTLEITALFIVVVPAWLLKGELTLATVILLLALSVAFKAVVLAWHFRGIIRGLAPPRKLSSKYFVAAWPFLLLTFSAMLQQRADLYSVAYFLDRRDLGVYQVFNSLLLACHFAASLFFGPFEKNLLRLPARTFAKFERNFVLGGTVLSGASIAAVYVVIRFCYGFDIPLGMYVFGYFYVLLYYCYALQCCIFVRTGRSLQMSYFTFAGCVANLLVGAFLISRFGIQGAIAAATLAQLLVVLLYRTTKAPVQAVRA